MRSHTGEKPYLCKYLGCGSAFKTRGHLKDHERAHTNVRPYECSICRRSFRRTSTLKVHKRIHSGERPYSCSYPGCGRTFTESGNLNTHKKLHSTDVTRDKQPEIQKLNRKKPQISAFVPYRPFSQQEKSNILSHTDHQLNPKNKEVEERVHVEKVNKVLRLNNPYNMESSLITSRRIQQLNILQSFI